MTDTVNPDDKALRELAEKAGQTDGDWSDMAYALDDVAFDPDKALILAMRPDVVLALLDRLAAAEARAELGAAALRQYGEHQHHWVPIPTSRYVDGVRRDAVEPEEGWDRMGVDRMCPDETTGECWCGLAAALREGATNATD